METTPTEVPVSTKKKRTLRQYAGLTLRGICMGASDIVPGVSGGTMAFILGIYEELINSIKTLGEPDFLLAVGKFQIRRVFQMFNWEFLVAVLLGIMIAVLTLAGILESLLINQPTFVWSFFFGLVVASAFVVSRRVKKWTVPTVIMLLLGTISAFLLVGLVPLQTPDTWWFWMLTGAIVSCALILPGVSGAFLLVLLGKYQETLAVVNAMRAGDFSQVSILVFLALGAAIGLILFSQVLSWLFKRYHDFTIAVLIGLMLGSLRKIWPWKQDIDWLVDTAGDYVLDSEGLRVVIKEINILPDFSTQAGLTEFAIAVLLMLLGITAVVLLDRVAGHKEEQETEAAPVAEIHG